MGEVDSGTMNHPDRDRPAASLRRFSSEGARETVSLVCQAGHGLSPALSVFFASNQLLLLFSELFCDNLRR